MADDPIYGNKDVFEQGGVGVVATLALAAQQLNVPLEVQGAIAMVGSFIGVGLGRSVYRAATRRYPAFAAGFLKAADPDPVKAGEKVKAIADQGVTESLDDIMMRSFRSMMDAVDDEVIPVLGYMAAHYTFQGRKADVFFRGMGRLLCEFEPGEFAEFTNIMKVACSNATARQMISAEVDQNGRLWVMEQNSSGHLFLNDVKYALRLFALMKREHFGTSTQTGAPRLGTLPGPEPTIQFFSGTALQILELVAPNDYAEWVKRHGDAAAP
ncbi:MAG: hypothetical protein WDO74_18000 [Pseudomonadota bacterium]